MKKNLLIAGIFFILIIAGLSGCMEQTAEDGNGTSNDLPPPPGPPNGVDDLSVKITKTASSYKKVDSIPTSGWFTNGQDADIVLNWFDFDNSGGPLRLYHPMGISNDGQHLIVADTCNNRVLIWNSLPTSNVAPDVVLGQTGFYTNSPGTTQYNLRWPVDVATDGEKIVVADTYNNRVLIWNSFPTTNGQPADIVLGQIDFTSATYYADKSSICWPWAVWTNGEKLIVTSTREGSVLIWNSFPTVNNQNPDLVMINDDFGTPRNIESDGSSYLFIGDHNAKGTPRGGNFLWHSFPTSNINYDAYIGGEVLWCSEIIDNDLYGTPGNQIVVIADFKQLTGDYDIIEMEQDGLLETFRDGYFESGDGSGMTYAVTDSNTISYLSLYNGARIVGYLGKPENREPDFVIGADSNKNPLIHEYYFMDNPDPIRYKDSLIVLCGFTKRIEVWKEIPDESGATPDIIYDDLQFEPISAAVYDDKVYIIGRGGHAQGGFMVWNGDDLINGEQPIAVVYNKLGSVDISEGKGITFDDSYAYISSNGKLYIWDQPFDWNSNPLKEITLESDIGKICSNGDLLACVYYTFSNTIMLIDVDSIADETPNYFTLSSDSTQTQFNLPSDVFIDANHLFVADLGNHRALVWNEIPSLSTDPPDIVIGQSTFTSSLPPKFTKDGLFFPAGVWFDGSYLWVGEFKFSHRVLRYSIQ